MVLLNKPIVIIGKFTVGTLIAYVFLHFENYLFVKPINQDG